MKANLNLRQFVSDLAILDYLGYGNLPKQYKNSLAHIVEKTKLEIITE